MTVDKRRANACLKACEGISTQNLEDNVPFLELARRYNAVLRERDALRAKIAEMERQEPVAEIGQQYTLLFAGSGPITGLVKRHGLKIGDKLYALPGAQPVPGVQDESVRKAWARFSHALHHSPDVPCPGMADAFEQHFSQSFIDREWRAEAATWAAAWKAAKRHCAQPAPSVPVEVVDLYNFMCAAFVPMTPQQEQIAIQLELAKRAMLAAAPEVKP